MVLYLYLKGVSGMNDILNYLLKIFNIVGKISYDYLITDNSDNLLGSIWQEDDVTYMELIQDNHLKVAIKPSCSHQSFIPGLVDQITNNYQIIYEINGYKNSLNIKNTIVYNIFILNQEYRLAIFANYTKIDNTPSYDFKSLEQNNLLKLKKETNFR